MGRKRTSGWATAGRVGIAVAAWMVGGCAQILGSEWDDYRLRGGAGGGGAGGDAQAGCADAAQDCPQTGKACVKAVCKAGACAERNAAQATVVGSQPAGGCMEQQCDGNGGVVEVPRPERAACTENGGAVCDGAGMCVACLDGTDCLSGACGMSSCVGTCGSADVVATPRSCASGNSGAGNNCGPANASCCDRLCESCRLLGSGGLRRVLQLR